MSNYILFAGSHYYPCGGMSDSQGKFNSIDEAKDHLSTDEFILEYMMHHDRKDLWAEIYDVSLGAVVCKYSYDCGWS